MMDMAAAEVGVRSGRTRGRDVAEEDDVTTSVATMETTPTVKRRKLEEVDGESDIKSSPCGIVVRDLAEPPETSVDVGRSSSDDDQCESRRWEDNVGEASLSCCSSNGTSEKVKGRMEFVDLEEDTVGETGTARHCSSSARRETSVGECWKVKEEEVEEFFMAAEKDLRNTILMECCRKYNFDFVKEEALEGRYEWLKFNP